MSVASVPGTSSKSKTAANEERGLARFGRNLAETPELGVVLACVVVFIGVWSAKNTFASGANLQEMGRNLAEYGILAIGESFVILTGGIDLSVGALAALSAVLSAWLVENHGFPLPLAILATLAWCAAVGSMHGWFITRLSVPPFVITLVTYTAARGLAQALTQSVPVTITNTAFQNISRTQIIGIPLPTFIFIVIAVVAWFVLERCYVGRQIYAVGGNREAARLAGINTSRRIMTTYITSSVLAGIVGIIIASRLGLGDPSVAQGYELQAIAAAVIGGVSLTGGQGRIMGIVAGAVLLVLISDGLIVLNVSPYYQQIVLGVVLGLAITADRLRARRLNRPRKVVSMKQLIAAVLAAGALISAPAAAHAADVLDHAAILKANHLDQPQWYEDNIPFLDTPDSNLNGVYYYRWSTYKRALRYTVPGTGYISTEYDVPIGYASDPYSGLPDAAGYHITDGRWLRDTQYAGDYLDFWLRGAGTSGQRSYSEWIAAAAYQRYLVTGDASQLKGDLRQLINLYNSWSSNYTASNGLYYQSPLSDATEYTETSMHSSDWFGGGSGYRPTVNTYQYAAAQAISKIAALTGDTADATAFATKADALKQAVQNQLWDPQRQFFMQIYNTNSTNGALKNTKTTWREAMGFTPWMYDLPDAQYSTAWKSLTDPDRFGAAFGPTTLERWTDFTPDASGNVTISAPAAGTYPVRVDGVTSTVAMKAGDNTLSYPGATKVQSNPYFDYQAIPAAANRDDNNCCHWNGPSWPYATSMELTGLANLLHDYPAQNDISAADYRTLLEQFATLQHKDGKPYVAEAADGDTGNWIYDGEDFSENYNHSSFNDLVLTGLLGIRPQAGDTLVLDPIVDPSWNYFAVEDVPYHGHLLTITWDRDGSHYGRGAGLQVLRDGVRIYSAATLAKATIDVGGRRVPAAPAKLMNLLSNPNSDDQDWLHRTITQPYPQAFASFTNPVSNGRHCHSGQVCQTTTFDTPGRATDGWIRYDKIPDDRWTNAGSTNATDYLGVNLGYARQLDELKLYTYDDGDTVRAPAGYDVQYLDGSTWRSVPGQLKSPQVPAANDVNEITFPTITTSQIRVVFTPQPGKFVGVAELESWWPQSAPVTITNVNSGLPLGIAGDSVNYGAAVTQQTATTSDSQRWDLIPAENGYYKIVNRGSGLALGITNASTAWGITALQWGDNLTPDHLWSLVDAGNGQFKIINKNSGLALGIQGALTTPGTVALQWGDTGTSDHLWTINASPTPVTASEDGGVGGTVPATLNLTLGAAPGFGTFLAGVANDYTASTTATVTSSAGDATLIVADPSTTATGHLVNGAFALASPLGGLGVVKTYSGPVSNDPVTIPFTQHIGATDPLRTGTYSKTLTFTLSTTTP